MQGQGWVENVETECSQEGFLEAVLLSRRAFQLGMAQAAHCLELLLSLHSMLPPPGFIACVLEWNKAFLWTRLGLHPRTAQAQTPGGAQVGRMN